MLSFIFTFLIFYWLYSIFFKSHDEEQWDKNRTFGENTYGGRYTGNQRNDFEEALLVLIAATMKADGHVLQSELDFVKKYLLQILGEERAKKALLRLRDILKMDIDVGRATMTIRYSLQYSSRLEIIHVLYGLANADGNVAPEERDLIFRIAYAIGLSRADTQSIFSSFADFQSESSLADAYKVLEISENATDEEVKKAYRTMAKKFHPDKLAGLGQEAQQNAANKFRKVQEAYEQIKKARGMK